MVLFKGRASGVGEGFDVCCAKKIRVPGDSKQINRAIYVICKKGHTVAKESSQHKRSELVLCLILSLTRVGYTTGNHVFINKTRSWTT